MSSFTLSNLNEQLLSRKIVSNSLSRHFAKWKFRQFILDRSNHLLGIKSKDQNTVLISLKASLISIKHHYNSNEIKFCLSLKYLQPLPKYLDEVSSYRIEYTFNRIEYETATYYIRGINWCKSESSVNFLLISSIRKVIRI